MNYDTQRAPQSQQMFIYRISDKTPREFFSYVINCCSLLALWVSECVRSLSLALYRVKHADNTHYLYVSTASLAGDVRRGGRTTGGNDEPKASPTTRQQPSGKTCYICRNTVSDRNRTGRCIRCHQSKSNKHRYTTKYNTADTGSPLTTPSWKSQKNSGKNKEERES